MISERQFARSSDQASADRGLQNELIADHSLGDVKSHRIANCGTSTTSQFGLAEANRFGKSFPVNIPEWSHLIPFRTQKLSTPGR